MTHPLTSPPDGPAGAVGSGATVVVVVVVVVAVVSGGTVVVGVPATSAGADDVVVALVVLVDVGAGVLVVVVVAGDRPAFVAATTPTGMAPLASPGDSGDGAVVTTTVSRRATWSGLRSATNPSATPASTASPTTSAASDIRADRPLITRSAVPFDPGVASASPPGKELRLCTSS
jgi:hypothetical protein